MKPRRGQEQAAFRPSRIDNIHKKVSVIGNGDMHTIVYSNNRGASKSLDRHRAAGNRFERRRP
jgi:hypothetical protein